MRTLLFPSCVAVLLTASVSVAADDPFLWLEEVQGQRALEWVKAQNAKTLAALEKDPRFEPFRTQALEILTATDRIPEPHFRAGGVDNFWQDQANPRGLLAAHLARQLPEPQPRVADGARSRRALQGRGSQLVRQGHALPGARGPAVPGAPVQRRQGRLRGA